MKSVFGLFYFILCLALPAAGQRLEGQLEFDGFPLEYIAEGNGPDVLVVGSARYYDRVFSKELRKSFRFTFIDHRGFASQGHAPDTALYLLNTIVKDIELFRSSLSLGKVIIMGHSGHSFMALEYAKAYPQHVSHVIMIGTAPDFGDKNAERIQEAWNKLDDPVRKKILAARRSAKPDNEILKLPEDKQQVAFYLRESPMIWYDAEYDAGWLWEDVRLDPFMSEYMWGHVFKEIDITRGLSDMKIPVFIALGKYDFLVAPPYTWNAYRNSFIDVTIRTFEESGHTPPLEEPAKFDSEFLKWLNSRQ